MHDPVFQRIFDIVNPLVLECHDVHQLQHSTSNSHVLLKVKSVRPAATAEEQDELVNATAVCQNVYLAAVLARVSEAVNAAFAGGNRALPTAAELHKCIGCVSDHLHQQHS